MATTKIRSSSITDGQVANADLSSTIGVTGDQIADDAVTTRKILDDNVTLAKMAGLARGSVIVGDASGDPSALALGTSTYLLTSDGSDAAWAAPPAGGLSQYSIWVMDTTFTGSAEPMTNWTEASLGYERIGTVIGESSGVFTLPETGKWEVHLYANGSGATWPTNTGNSYHIQYSTNSGVSFSDITRADRWGYGGQYEQTNSASVTLFDVTNTSTHLMRFRCYARTGTNITGGDGSQLRTYVVFKKIGAT